MEHRIYNMSFESIYAMYLAKVLRKDRTKDELDTVIRWLLGYSQEELEENLESKTSVKDFFNNAPMINPNSDKITGVVCCVRVEDVEDPLMQKIRYLDKLVDELAKGRKMDKILRN